MAEPGTWRELLPVAYLLTGNDTAARDLLIRALARGGGVEGVVHAHLGRRFRGAGAIRGTSGAPWWVSPEDVAAAARLATALDALGRPERTAVVLRWFAGLPGEQVAALLPGVDPAAAAARLAGEVPDPADLPARLDGLAALVDPSSLTDDDVELGVRGVRSGRRSRVALAIGAVAVLGVGAVLLPDALPSTPPQAAATATTADRTVEVGPPRGSLADDEEFLDDVRAEVGWAPGTGQVVYAGDTGGIRWALLLRRGSGATDVAWLTGPAGAAGRDLTGSSASYSGPRPDTWSTVADVEGAPVLLVVAEPDDELEVSPGFDVAPDGTATRTFQAVDVEDGVAAVRLDRPTGWGVLVRLVRDDVVGLAESPWLVTFPGPASVPATATVRSGTEPVDPSAYSAAVDRITWSTGWTVADLDITILGSGSYPAPGGAVARAVTVAAVVPGGAVVTSTGQSVTDDVGMSSDSCGSDTHPAGTDPASLTLVTRCGSYAGDGSTFGATVLVSAPPGVDVRLNTAAGGAPQAPVLQAGWGYVIDAGDELTEFSADGTLGTVSREGAGPFDDY